MWKLSELSLSVFKEYIVLWIGSIKPLAICDQFNLQLVFATSAIHCRVRLKFESSPDGVDSPPHQDACSNPYSAVMLAVYKRSSSFLRF